jgi:hypothetical protein
MELSDAAAAGLTAQGLTVHQDAQDGTWTVCSTADRVSVMPLVRPRMTPATVALAARATDSRLPLLITPRLSAGTLAACRANGVSCADAAGNMYLRFGGTLIDIEGRRTPTSAAGTQGTRGSLLATPAGLQITFLLLCDEGAVGWPMRRLATATGTALGSVAATLKDLETNGFLERAASDGRRLHRAGKLFDRWVDGYSLVLDHRLTLGTFRNDAGPWWTEAAAQVEAAGGQWGGETAAWRRGLDLLPARGIMYSPQLPTSLLTDLRMQRCPEPEATLIVRRKFWTEHDLDEGSSVPAPLIYADLTVAGDPRLTAAAEELRHTDETLRRLDGARS